MKEIPVIPGGGGDTCHSFKIYNQLYWLCFMKLYIRRMKQKVLSFPHSYVVFEQEKDSKVWSLSKKMIRL